MDVARVEAGLILIEVEYSSSHRAIAQEQHYSPFELGLGRLVDLKKASPFNGKRALLAEQASGGPARRLVGLELEWAGIEGLFAKHDLAPAVSPLVHRDPVPVYKEGKQVGRATSVTWGPTIKKMVGLRLGGQARSRRSARGSRSSGASRASAARWPPTVVPDAVPRPRAQAHVARLRETHHRLGQPDRGAGVRGEAVGADATRPSPDRRALHRSGSSPGRAGPPPRSVRCSARTPARWSSGTRSCPPRRGGALGSHRRTARPAR